MAVREARALAAAEREVHERRDDGLVDALVRDLAPTLVLRSEQRCNGSNRRSLLERDKMNARKTNLDCLNQMSLKAESISTNTSKAAKDFAAR